MRRRAPIGLLMVEEGRENDRAVSVCEWKNGGENYQIYGLAQEQPTASYHRDDKTPNWYYFLSNLYF
jgi:hypothetical protein